MIQLSEMILTIILSAFLAELTIDSLGSKIVFFLSSSLGASKVGNLSMMLLSKMSIDELKLEIERLKPFIDYPPIGHTMPLPLRSDFIHASEFMSIRLVGFIIYDYLFGDLGYFPSSLAGKAYDSTSLISNSYYGYPYSYDFFSKLLRITFAAYYSIISRSAIILVVRDLYLFLIICYVLV